MENKNIEQDAIEIYLVNRQINPKLKDKDIYNDPDNSEVKKDIPLKNIISYSFSDNYTEPCQSFSFSIYTDDVNDYVFKIISGQVIRATLRGNSIFAGIIDNLSISYTSSGTIITYTGRDMLSRLVNSNVDPNLRIKSEQTTESVINPILDLYAIGTLSGIPTINFYISSGLDTELIKPSEINGYRKFSILGEKTNAVFRKVFDPIATKKAKEKAQSSATSKSYQTGTIATISKTEDKFKSVRLYTDADSKLKKQQPQVGEGTYSFLNRQCSYSGSILKAIVDGSGAFLSYPLYDEMNKDFTGVIYCDNSFVNDYDKKNYKNESSNVISCDYKSSFNTQPSHIIAEGYGGGGEFGRSKFKVFMINELMSFIAMGLSPSIERDINAFKKYAKYYKDEKGFTHSYNIPFRDNVARTFLSSYYGYNPDDFKSNDQSKIDKSTKALDALLELSKKQYIYCPVYIKDNEAKDIKSLSNRVIRKMSEFQIKSLTLKYTVIGHTYKSANNLQIPWMNNTMVFVRDEKLNIKGWFWIKNRSFKRDLSGGMTTELEIIPPYLLDLKVDL